MAEIMMPANMKCSHNVIAFPVLKITMQTNIIATQSYYKTNTCQKYEGCRVYFQLSRGYRLSSISSVEESPRKFPSQVAWIEWK